MVTPAIRDFSQRIVERFSPERVILFGSHARDEEGPDSDVDVLVILEHNKRNVEKAIEILHAVDRDFPLDLLVRTPSDVNARLATNDFFMRDVIREGVVLYDSGS